MFLFLLALVDMQMDRGIVVACGLPGTNAIPAANAMRSLLGLKLFGTQRHVHVMSAVLDEGLALFCQGAPKLDHEWAIETPPL